MPRLRNESPHAASCSPSDAASAPSAEAAPCDTVGLPLLGGPARSSSTGSSYSCGSSSSDAARPESHDPPPASPSCDVPERFLCPISQSLMLHPVRCDSGKIYDRESLECWFESGGATCPLTRAVVSRDVSPVPELQQEVHAWLRSSGHHSSFELVQLSDSAVQVSDGHFLVPAAPGSSPLEGRRDSRCWPREAALSGLVAQLSVVRTSEGQASLLQSLLCCASGPRAGHVVLELVALGTAHPLVRLVLTARPVVRVLAADLLSRLSMCPGSDTLVLAALLQQLPGAADALRSRGLTSTLHALAAALVVGGGDPGDDACAAAWALWLMTPNEALRARIAHRARPLPSLQRMLASGAGDGCAVASAHLLRSLALVREGAEAMLADGTLASLLVLLQTPRDAAQAFSAATALSNAVFMLQRCCAGSAGGPGRSRLRVARAAESFITSLCTSSTLLAHLCCLLQQPVAHGPGGDGSPYLGAACTGGGGDRLDAYLTPHVQRAAAVLLRSLCGVGKAAAQPMLASGCVGALLDHVASHDPVTMPAAVSALRALLFCLDPEERAVLVAMGAVEAVAGLLALPFQEDVHAGALHMLNGLVSPLSAPRFARPAVWRMLLTMLHSDVPERAYVGLQLLLRVAAAAASPPLLPCGSVKGKGKAAPPSGVIPIPVSRAEAGVGEEEEEKAKEEPLAWSMVVDDDRALRNVIRLLAADTPRYRVAAAQALSRLSTRAANRDHIAKAGAIHALVDAVQRATDPRVAGQCDGPFVVTCLRALRELAQGGRRQQVLSACEGDRQLIHVMTSLLGGGGGCQPQREQQDDEEEEPVPTAGQGSVGCTMCARPQLA